MECCVASGIAKFFLQIFLGERSAKRSRVTRRLAAIQRRTDASQRERKSDRSAAYAAAYAFSEARLAWRAAGYPA
jgi:hypothetical protein